MPVETTSRPIAVAPNGGDDLAVRERWLKSRHRSRDLGHRGLSAFWVGLAALASWLFVAAFAGLGH